VAAWVKPTADEWALIHGTASQRAEGERSGAARTLPMGCLINECLGPRFETGTTAIFQSPCSTNELSRLCY